MLELRSAVTAWKLFLLAVIAHIQANFNVTLLVTSEVSGAILPIKDSSGAQCSTWSSVPCDCVGGAARLQTALAGARARDDVVAIDTGARFFGSGLAFPTFEGNATINLTVGAGYQALGLSYRDFTPGGGAFLAKYLTQLGNRKASLLPAVATNLNITGDPHLHSALVDAYKVISIGSRRLALLNMVDPINVVAVNPSLSARFLPWVRALETALVSMRRLPQGMPDVVVLSIGGIPPELSDQELSRAKGDVSTARRMALEKIVVERTGVNIVIFSGSEGDGGIHVTQAYTLRNWAGDPVLMVPVTNAPQGRMVEEVTAVLGSSGVLSASEPFTHTSRSLKCQAEGGVADDVAVAAQLVSYESTIQGTLSTIRGYLQNQAEGRELFQDPALPASAPSLILNGQKFYGCRVTQCGAGTLIANAWKQLTVADIGMTNGGGIKTSFPSGPVTTALSLEVLPWLNEIVRLDNVPGSVLRDALRNSISKLGSVTSTYSSGRFLQTSDNFHYKWYFEGKTPRLGEVTINGKLLNDTTFYSVATNAYVAGGGDGYTMLNTYTGRAVMRTSRAGYEAVGEYMEAVAPSSPGLAVSTSVHILQQAAVVILDVGNMCRALDEQCDVVRHMADVINDKHDGFMDDLLEFAFIKVSVPKIVGCSEGVDLDLARTAYRELASEMPDITGVMGPPCSDDARDVSAKTWRDEMGHDTLFLSHLSTAPSLKDGVKYPFLIRFQTPEHLKVKGFVKIMVGYGWKRLGLLYDSSEWGTGLGFWLKDEYLKEADTSILNPATEKFVLEDFDTGALTGTELVNKLDAVGARIAFIGSQLRVQTAIFVAVYKTRTLYGLGYAWITGWSSEDVFKNSGTSVVNADAVRGAEGLLGMIGRIDPNNAVRDQYMKLWAAKSSKEACVTGGATARHPYCDGDGDPETIGSGTSFKADSMLAFAMGMDKIYQTDPHDSAALEREILNLTSFAGITSTRFDMDTNGDRKGTFDVQNVQIAHGDGRRLRRLYVSLQATQADFKVVGKYDLTEGLSWENGTDVLFPGNTKDIPLDQVVVPSVTSEGLNMLHVGLIIGGLVLLGMMLAFCYYRYNKRQFAKLRGELEQFKEAIVGVRVVTKNYLPGDSLLGTVTELPARSYWYWLEDSARLSSHNSNDVYQLGSENFVKYAGSVCAELEEAYASFMDKTGDPCIAVNLVDRIGSTGTEKKAAAEESGYDFKVDFNKMMQINAKTGFGRKVLRIQEVPQETVQKRQQRHDQIQESLNRTNSLKLPDELQEENAAILLLYVGQLVQTSRTANGWCYGTVIYDEVKDRPPVHADGISITDGWFPYDCTALPSAKQLEKLQAQMGGVDALAPPSAWNSVMKDPLTAELFAVSGKEKEDAIQAFMRTLDPSKVQVVSVERIQNMSLWQSFAVKRQTMMQREKDAAKAKSFEKLWLFHGAPDDIIPKILQQGFNRSFCGRNATMYGKGVYFARDASYSSSKAYSAPDVNGVQRMLLCRVVVGEWCKGKKDAIAPDVRSGLTLYDTTVDNFNDPSIFVTYHDAQAYPEYIVHFKS